MVLNLECLILILWLCIFLVLVVSVKTEFKVCFIKLLGLRCFHFLELNSIRTLHIRLTLLKKHSIIPFMSYLLDLLLSLSYTNFFNMKTFPILKFLII